MKRFWSVVFAIAFMGVLAFGFSIVPTNLFVAKAASVPKFDLLSPEFASSVESLTNLGIDQTKVDNYTPYDESSYAKMAGKSFTPGVSGQDGYKVVDTTISVGHITSGIDVSSVQNVSDLCLNLWINFDAKLTNITKSLTITLEDDSASNSISWTLDGVMLQNLLTRSELGYYDKILFASSSVAIIGWCEFNLPFSKSTTTGSIVNGNKFIFTKIKIQQSGANFADDQPLTFYDINLKEDSTVTDYKVNVQDYANISLKSNLAIIDSEKDYYVGEVFTDTLSKNGVFNCCFVGRVNYLLPENNNLLIVEADPEMGIDKIKSFSYGIGSFVLEETSYKLKYCIKYNSKNYSIISDTLMASSYGKGIWIEPINGDIEVGKQYTLSYTVHKAFTGDMISFESTNEDVLKILEIDKTNKKLIVQALKVGKAGITASLFDDRLVGTDFEDTGIINDNFSVSVVKAENKANTTVIMLWVALGVVVSVTLYFGIKEIIKARKLEIK